MNKITAKAILGELLEAYEQCEHGDYFYDNGDSVCNAVECVLREQPCWISVEERLPDKKGEYLTYDQWGYGAVIKTAYWTPKYDGFDEYLRGRSIWHNYDSEYGCYELTGITHWMPLPDAPEVEV